MFLTICAHGFKYRDVRQLFPHSTDKICRWFRTVLTAVVSLVEVIIRPSEETLQQVSPVLVHSWGGAFARAIGALDGTHVGGIFPRQEWEYYRG